MILKRFYDTQLAHASYLVGCAGSGEAVVVDPNREIAQYIQAAEDEKLKIVAITETHIHADFVSGARQLADATGAQLYLTDEGDEMWKYQFADQENVTLVKDGDHIRIGRIRLDVRHTPGHTPEHISFVLTDEASSDQPLGAFTGDFIFVGDVGRPDLLERAAGFEGTMENGAKVLHQSLRKFIKDMPAHLMIWPAHGAGSACGKSLGGVPDSVLAYELLANWGLKMTDEAQFVEAVLSGQPEPPHYFKEMKRVNKVGPESIPAIDLVEQLHGERALDIMEKSLVIDLRPSEQWISGSLHGTVSLPMGPGFLTWAGSVLPIGEPVTLLGTKEQATAAARLLRLIGYDKILGWVSPAILRGQTLETVGEKVGEEAVELARQGRAVLLDVRGRTEYAEMHLEPSKNIPLGELLMTGQSLSPDDEIIVTCAGGARSPIAVSLLRRMGFRRVSNLSGGVSGCPSDLCATL